VNFQCQLQYICVQWVLHFPSRLQQIGIWFQVYCSSL
jgi:hypothetical protein